MTPEPKARVLAVDDEEALLRYYQRAVGSAGYEVVTCERPSDALAELDKARFDVIITDLAMPGMSGIELLRAVRTRDMDVPVIIITASPALETALQAIDEGAMRYLVKPVRAEQLLSAVERAVALGRMSRLKRQALALLQQRGDEPGDRASAMAAFERALAGLTMAYQPVVDVAAGTVYGYEALMRSSEKAYASPMVLLEASAPRSTDGHGPPHPQPRRRAGAGGSGGRRSPSEPAPARSARRPPLRPRLAALAVCPPRGPGNH